MNINSIGNVVKIIAKAGDAPTFTKLPDMPNDVFVKSADSIKKAVSSADEALKKAFEFCQESVKREKPVESQMVFDSMGKVLYTNEGDISHCKIEYEKITPGSVAIHSHPDSCIFSIEDVMSLITKPNIKKIGSIDPQGRTCLMEKPEDFITPDRDTTRYLYRAFNTKLKQSWEDAIGTIENPKAFCIEENEKRLMKAYNCNSLEALYNKLGFEKPQDIEENFSRINSAFYKDEIWNLGDSRPKPLGEYNTESAVQAFRIENVKTTPEGIEVGNEIMKSIAKTLGLKYEYNPA